MESYHNKSYRMKERLLEEEFILPHIASAPLRQVDLGRRSKNNPHFLPCRFCSLFFLFRKGSRGCKKKQNNKIPASAKYQTWPWKPCRGAGLGRMFHPDVVVVAVGDAGWSQQHMRLVSGGRWEWWTLLSLDLPLSHTQPQNPHNFPLSPLVVLSCSPVCYSFCSKGGSSSDQKTTFGSFYLGIWW